MSDRDDTRDTRDNTRECGSMFDPRAERADTHTRGAPTGFSSDRPRENTHSRGANGPRSRTRISFDVSDGRFRDPPAAAGHTGVRRARGGASNTLFARAEN